MAALLSRESLLTKEELKIEKVNLGKGDFVYVRQMTGRERDRFELSMTKQNEKGDYERNLEDFRAKLVVNTVCDEKGNNLLKHEDYPTLSQNMSAAKLEKMVEAAQKLNSISEEDKEALVKN